MKLNIFGLEDMNLVQIQIVSNNDEFEKFSDSAKYLESSVFSIFRNCFELSYPDFKYSGNNLFSTNQVVTLRHHLMTQLTRILAIHSPEDLQTFVMHQIAGLEFMDELKTLYQDWQIFWEVIRDKLTGITNDLIELADNCIDDEKELFVKGY